LTVPSEVRKTPLSVAISTGFHSLVELLLRHEENQKVKNDTLQLALLLDQHSFIELAAVHGAEIASVPFLDVLMTGNRAVAASFLERGADPIADYPFARAFHQLRAKTTLGSYLDCRRIRPDLAEQLQEQADMALRQFCQEGKLRWVCLLMWAGADPRSRGPALDDADHGEDPEWHTTALHEACGSDNVEILKRLRPTRTDDLAGMLERAAYYARHDILACLLELGANPNDKADGGSSALDVSIKHLGWEDFSRKHEYGAEDMAPGCTVSREREAIKVLLRYGALWRPELSTLHKARRILYRTEPEVTVTLIGMLLSHENGQDAARELLRVAQMRQHVASCEGQLSKLGITLDGRRRSEVPTAPAPPSYVVARYDRERLYVEVWSEPTQEVARRYGISDVALSKVCKQLRPFAAAPAARPAPHASAPERPLDNAAPGVRNTPCVWAVQCSGHPASGRPIAKVTSTRPGGPR
jgi:ankyrin repeat protein